MVSLRNLFVVISLVLCCCASTASAETRVALIVANGAYEDAALQNPTVDADLIRPALEGMGFTVRVVTDADLAGFALALQSFYADAKGADLALFYFAGHGFAVDGHLGSRNYLMSTSADVTSTLDVVIRAGGIPLDEIVAALGSVAKTTLVFVDACRNDPRVSRGAGTGRGLARIETAGLSDLFVGLSTRLGDTAADGEPGAGSPFARAFAAHIAGPGLRVDDAFTEVRKAVIAETGGDQRPEIVQDDLDAPVVLVNAPDGGGKAAASVSPGQSAAALPPAEDHAGSVASQDAQLAVARCETQASSDLIPDRVIASTFFGEAPEDAFRAIDASRAVEVCRDALAHDAGNPRLLHLLGRSLDAAGKPGEAATYYRRSAESGYTPAKASLAVLLFGGIGIEEDKAQAIALLEEAVRAPDQGLPSSPAAKAWLASLHANGEGIAQEHPFASQLFNEAAFEGQREALVQFALWHIDRAPFFAEFGGSERDPAEAASLLRRAAGMGSPSAMMALALHGSRGDLPGVDLAEAAQAFLDAYAVGHPDAFGFAEHKRLQHDFSDAFRKEAQRRLAEGGYYDGGIDGVIGRRALAAMRTYAAARLLEKRQASAAAVDP